LGHKRRNYVIPAKRKEFVYWEYETRNCTPKNLLKKYLNVSVQHLCKLVWKYNKIFFSIRKSVWLRVLFQNENYQETTWSLIFPIPKYTYWSFGSEIWLICFRDYILVLGQQFVGYFRTTQIYGLPSMYYFVFGDTMQV